MTPDDIEKLVRLLEKHGIGSFTFEQDGKSLSLKLGRPGSRTQATGPVPEAKAAPAEVRQDTIDAPCVGHFLSAHPLDTGAKPALPRRVEAGEIVAYLKAGALLRPVAAPKAGILSRQIMTEGALAGYGDALFALS